MIVAWAYPWVESQRYDIFAKAGRTVSEDELRQMLQALLVERFKLAVHREKPAAGRIGAAASQGGSQDDTIANRGANAKSPGPGAVARCRLADRRYDRPHGPVRFHMEHREVRIGNAGTYHGGGEADQRVRRASVLVQDILAGELELQLETRKAPVEN